MNPYLDQLDNVLKPLETDWDFFETSFTTSADVVMKASGLRLEAIRVIARADV